MKNKILLNLKDGLIDYLGMNSQFEDCKVEEIMNQYPSIVTTNNFIGIDIQNSQPRDREIGQFGSLIKDYSCSIVILVKGADYDTMREELDTITHRVIRYLSLDTGHLDGLQDIIGTDIERVLTYKIDGITYGNGKMKGGSLGHICDISIIITTEVIFS